MFLGYKKKNPWQPSPSSHPSALQNIETQSFKSETWKTFYQCLTLANISQVGGKTSEKLQNIPQHRLFHSFLSCWALFPFYPAGLPAHFAIFVCTYYFSIKSPFRFNLIQIPFYPGRACVDKSNNIKACLSRLEDGGYRIFFPSKIEFKVDFYTALGFPRPPG